MSLTVTCLRNRFLSFNAIRAWREVNDSAVVLKNGFRWSILQISDKLNLRLPEIVYRSGSNKVILKGERLRKIEGTEKREGRKEEQKPEFTFSDWTAFI